MAKRTVEPCAVRGAFTPSTVNAQRRTVDIVWTTGAKVLRNSYFDGPSFEELSLDPKHVRMGRLNDGAPFLAEHDGHVDSVMGVVESARLEGGRGVATVRFPTEGINPKADQLFAMVKDGIVQNISVGYRTYRSEKVESGDAKIPTFRATDWEPYELSAVAMGADPAAHFRSVENQTPNECEFVTRGAQMDPEELKRQEEAAQKAAMEARALELKIAQETAAKAERERASGIRSAVKAASLDSEVADKLVADGVSLDAARAFVLDEMAKRSESIKTEQHTKIEVTDDAQDKFSRGVQAWLFERSGAGVVEKAKKANVKGFEKVDLDGGEFRGMSLVDLARESLERRGVKTRGLSRMDLVGKALTSRSGGYAGTSDFPVLLENTIGKILLAAYATTPDTWSRFCKIDTVPDFRDSPRYRTGSFGALDSLSEAGEFKNKAIPDGAKTAINVATKGNVIAITRQLIINDDLSALSDLAVKLGRGARLSIEQDVYALLTANSGLGATQSDSNPFFHSSRANVNATGSALSVAGLDADRVVMLAQKDISSNDYLDMRPSILLVPSGLGGAARVINEATFNHDSTKLQQPNMVRGLFTDIIDTPRLTGTRRYLLASPDVAPAIVVAFLEGQGQGPVMETQDGWRVDGTEMKVRMDYKAQTFDPKGAVTNAGA